jgi:hypothetical protein
MVDATHAMPKRPEPPEGYETWLDWYLDDAEFFEHGGYARAELEELRNELVLLKATAKEEESVEVFTTT